MITNPTLDPKLYPPAAQDFFNEFKAKYGKDPEPYAIYGYEAMSVVLEAIKAAGDEGNDRQAVIDAFFSIKDRESVLGTYEIDENGDTTLTDYGGNRIEGGKLAFDKVIKAATSERKPDEQVRHVPPSCLGRAVNLEAASHAHGSRNSPSAQAPPGRRAVSLHLGEDLWIMLGGALLLLFVQDPTGRCTTSRTGCRTARSGR